MTNVYTRRRGRKTLGVANTTMAANNMRVLKGGRTVMRFRTEANVRPGFSAGEAIEMATGTGTNYVDVCLDGTPVQGTDMFLGVSKSDATNTTAADGIVDVELCIPSTILEILANTPSNINTDALLRAELLDFKSLDRSATTAAGVLTYDENETNNNDTLGFIFLDGRITDGMCYITPGNAWYGRGMV